MSNQIKQRNEVDDKFKWKISDLFETDKKWNEEYSETESKIPLLAKFNGNLTEDNIFDCFSLKEKLAHSVERLYVYANLRSHEDSTNTFYQAMADKADKIIMLFESASSFIEPAVLSLNETEIMTAVNEKAPVYKHYFEDLFRSKAHILSADKEDMLARMYDLRQAPDNIFSMLDNADLKFDNIINSEGKEVPLTHATYISYLESPDRNVRKAAFDSYYRSYHDHKNTIAAIYSSSVKKDIFLANIRNYSSSLEAALSAYNIPLEVYHNLIDTVGRFLPLMHRYISLRKKCLALDDLCMYDLYTPIVKDCNTSKSYDEAKATVTKAVEVLGEDYLTTFRSALESGWIDVYENKGKRSGAYSWGAYGTHPFVSLNYNNTVNNMFTLAHEMGHAMHSHYTWSNQPYIYGDYTIFVAEVASTVNEALLMEYLLKTTEDKTEKKYLINYFMEQFRGTLFRQTMFAEFELKAHEAAENGEALTFDYLCSIYSALNKKYYGNDIIFNPEISWEWARIPHFYTAFYVYQYATGYSAAIALSRRILKENGAADYLRFLKGGSSDYSIELLKTAGVDMSKTEPIENAMAVFEDLLNQMEKLIEED